MLVKSIGYNVTLALVAALVLVGCESRKAKPIEVKKQQPTQAGDSGGIPYDPTTGGYGNPDGGVDVTPGGDIINPGQQGQGQGGDIIGGGGAGAGAGGAGGGGDIVGGGGQDQGQGQGGGNQVVIPNPNGGGGSPVITPTNNGTTDMNVQVVLGNGQTANTQWDGLRDQSNNFWDVVSVQ